MHCVCSIHLLTCHLISRLRSRARQHVIHQIYIFELRVTKRAQTTLQNVSLKLQCVCFECVWHVCQTVHVMKPTDQLSDKTGDDQCAVALHHRFLGTFIIMWQLDFSMWIFNHRNFFVYRTSYNRRHCLR